MSTAGEKFFEVLTNGELTSMARTTGLRLEDWENEASGLTVNMAVVKAASLRAGKPLGDAQLNAMTPKQTQERLEELLGELGFVDDEDVEPDLTGSVNETPRTQPKIKQTSA